MKTLYNKRGLRRGDGDRSQFAFFLTGAIVVLSVVFVIGIQVGRVIEKHAVSKEVASGKTGGAIVVGKETPGEIGNLSGTVGKADPVGTPSPEERVRDTERSVTFRETLERKVAAPPKLVGSVTPTQSSATKRAESPPPESRLYVQAGAFRQREGADAMQKRLKAAGYPSIISPSMSGTSGMIHRVLVGPYAGKQDAGPVLRNIENEFRTRPFLVRH